MKSPITALLVDDDPDDQDFFELIMHEIEVSVNCLFANDGSQAMEKLDSMSVLPHILFIDINMPKVNGIFLLSELKSTEKYKNIPTYMYSTFADRGTIDKCKKLGALDFIKKHTSISDAKSEFEKLLQNINKADAT